MEAGGRTVLVDTRDAGVEVETVPAPITWSDGDLVEHTTAGWIGWRESGNWWTTTQAKHNSSGPFCHGDELVERMLRDDELRVVRCQHADRLREQVLS